MSTEGFSSQPTGGMGGILIPPLPRLQRDIQPAMPSLMMPDSVQGLIGNLAVIIPPPSASGGSNVYGPNVASAPKSVAEVVYDVTPVAGIQGLLMELRDRRPRPALPPGIANRAPAWVRDRFTQLQRGAVRALPIKKNVPIPPPLTRE